MLGKGTMQSRGYLDLLENECGQAGQQNVDASTDLVAIDESEINSEIVVLDDADPSLMALEILNVSKGEQLYGVLQSLHQALSALQKTSGRRLSTT